MAYKFNLDQEQIEAIKLCKSKSVNIITGAAGTSKTTVALAAAIELLGDTNVPKYQRKEGILLIKPIQTIGKDLGAIPGELDDKIKPFIESIHENIIDLAGRSYLEQIVNNKKIDYKLIQYARGKTWNNKIVIIDEFQNMNTHEFEAIVTRLGKDSIFIFTGDEKQIDLKFPAESCIYKINKLRVLEDIGFIEMQTNRRHPLTLKIVKTLNE